MGLENKKILWICGCNSLSINGMKRKRNKILKENNVTHIVDYHEIYKDKIDLKEFDKIIYDDSYSACSYARKERSSLYLNFSVKNIKHELKVNLHD